MEKYKLLIHSLLHEEVHHCSDVVGTGSGVAFRHNRWAKQKVGEHSGPEYAFGYTQLPFTIYTSGESFEEFVAQCNDLG